MERQFRNRKVFSATAHVGVQLGNKVANTFLVGKNCEAAALSEFGLHITRDGKDYIIPYANFRCIELLPPDEK